MSEETRCAWSLISSHVDERKENIQNLRCEYIINLNKRIKKSDDDDFDEDSNALYKELISENIQNLRSQKNSENDSDGDDDALCKALTKENKPNFKGQNIIDRYNRIKKSYDDWDNDISHYGYQNPLDKAFKAISKYAQSDDAVLIIFNCLPDKETEELFPLIYGKRGRRADAEQDDYHKIIKAADSLFKLIVLNPKVNSDKSPIFNMIADLDNDYLLKGNPVIRQLYSLPKLLKLLIKVAENANPAKKYLTTKIKAKDADKQSYIALLAMLNDIRNLSKPCHAAIATIAMANNPKTIVTKKAIQDAFTKMPHDVKNYIKEVAVASLSSINSLLSHWFPGGKWVGKEYEVLNPTRYDNKEGLFKIDKYAKWSEFKDNAKIFAGDDLVSLVAYLERINNFEAAKQLGTFLGIPYQKNDTQKRAKSSQNKTGDTSTHTNKDKTE